MGRYDHIIEEIKGRGNIVDIVSNYVNLKKAGANYKGCCPFHNEKTPSFIVSEEKQIFTCFGCGATGNIITFLQKIENLEFPEAVEKLADRLGIEMNVSGFKAETNKNKFYDINREAALIFYGNLKNEQSKGAAYVKKRGLSPSTVKRFGLGYAEDSWEHLMNQLLEQKIEEKDLLDLGLISKNAAGKKFDKFRNRLIFPIINTRGKIVGFGGRAIGDETPKYLNSPETIVFSKKNNLFGLNLTRKEINIRNCVILVEGYMDVISLYQYGVRNVAASLGTALTAGQATMIKRYAGQVIIAYDSDKAGQAAALRAIDVLYEAGCSIKVLQVTGAKDPDEFVVKNGAAAFYEIADKAPTFVEFKVRLAKQKYDMTTTSGSVDFLKEVAGILKGLKSSIEADVYIEKIAADTRISAGAIRNEIYGGQEPPNMMIPGQSGTFSEPPQSGIRPAAASHKDARSAVGDFLEKSMIRLLLAKAEYTPRIQNKEEVFNNPIYLKMFDIIVSLYTDDSEIDTGKLRDSLSGEENLELDHILQNVLLGEDDEIFFRDCMNQIQKTKRKAREKEILDILMILDEESNQEQIRDLMRELVEMRND